MYTTAILDHPPTPVGPCHVPPIAWTDRHRPGGAGHPAVRPAPSARLGHVPMRQAVLAVAAEPAWVPVVRRSATAVLACWGLAETARDVAELLIGELAANAAQHGRHHLTLNLTHTPGVLRMSLSDSGGPPTLSRPAAEDPDEHGRGLAIVEALADHVQVHQHDQGRRVDVSLRVGEPSSPGGAPVPRTAQEGRP